MCLSVSAKAEKAEALTVKIEPSEKQTLVSVEGGTDCIELLAHLSSVFSGLDLVVVSTSQAAGDSGDLVNEFLVTTREGAMVDEKEYDSIQKRIQQVPTVSTSTSMPAIYGDPRQSSSGSDSKLGSVSEDQVSQLEQAANEMAKAAMWLVNVERQLVEVAATATEQKELAPLEQQRSEAAQLLERRMSAMEQAMEERTGPKVKRAPPSAARGGGAELRFQQGGGTGTGPAAGNGYEIILQGFNWESCKEPWYKVLSERIEDIADDGFTAVWMPPPSDSVSEQGYLPRDLYKLDSFYGSQDELQACLSKLHDNGLKAIADVVINHRCAHEQGKDGKWNKFGGRLAWDHTYLCCNNQEFGGTGSLSSGQDYSAAPNIDHTQERVQKDITEWLKYLRRVGFDGWRLDFSKGYAGEYVKQYINATTPEMAFGEFWDACDYSDGKLNYNQNDHRQRTVDWCDATGGTAAAFDFTTKGILQEAVGRSEYWRLADSKGRPAGMVGLWPSRAITFLENHDTGSTLNHWPFPYDNLCEGYAYLLTHPGTPCVFYDHYYQEHNKLRTAIQELLTIRRKNKIFCRSKVTIHAATDSIYAATIDDKVAMKIGWGNWTPNDAKLCGKKWKLASSGHNFAVWQGS